VHQLCDTQAQRLDALALRLGGPARAVSVQRQALVALDERLRLALRHAVAGAAREPQLLAARLQRAMLTQRERQAQRLQATAQRLSALDPQRVLARGYAWMADAQGRPVLSARSVSAGDRLGAVWADGSAQVEVLQVQSQDPAPPSQP